MTRPPAPPSARASFRPWAYAPRSPLRRFLERRRRTLAAALLCVAAGAAVHQLTPPSAAMASVAVAARDLAGGATVSNGDVRVARLPADAVPQHAESDPARLVGQRLSGPVRSGEALTDAALVGPGLLTGTSPDTAAVPVRVADPASLQLLRPGHLVDVVLSADAGSGSAPGTTLAAQVPVLWAGGAAGSGASGPWLGSSKDADGLLVVAARPDQALRIAGASARGKVFFTLVEAGRR